MTNETIPVYEMKLKGLAPKDAWTLSVTENGRRLSITPEAVEVNAWKPLKSDLRMYVSIRGRVIRQSDGEVTGTRRSVTFCYDDDVSHWNDRTMDEPTLDPELRAFALDARKRIETALRLTQ